MKQTVRQLNPFATRLPKKKAATEILQILCNFFLAIIEKPVLLIHKKHDSILRLIPQPSMVTSCRRVEVSAAILRCKARDSRKSKLARTEL
jgi:hypothetical protein